MKGAGLRLIVRGIKNEVEETDECSRNGEACLHDDNNKQDLVESEFNIADSHEDELSEDGNG